MDILNIGDSLKNLNILYLEDEEVTRNTIQRLLGYYSDDIYAACDGNEAIKLFDENEIDLIITDLETPNLNGIEFITHVRKNNPSTPVIVFSAYTDKKHLIPCLNLNVQGFIEKPISFDKLFDALKKIDFVEKTEQETIFKLSENITYDKKQMLIIKNNEEINLTKKEVKLLNLFLDKKDEIISYETIENFVWEDHEVMTDGALRTFLKALRQKTDKDIIKSVYGIGYKLVTKI